jgi:prophage regulatory protein
MSTTEFSDRIVRSREVMAKTSLSRTTLWRMAHKGTFPRPIKLSDNRIGWSLSAVDAWIEARRADALDEAA